MDLKTLTRSVQEQLVATAAVGDEPTRRAAQLLTVSLEPALRLALQEAIGQVAAEISSDLAPGRVDLSLSGGELEVRVVPPTAPSAVPPTVPPAMPPAAAAPPPAPGAPPAPPEEGVGAEAPASRVTFRPPQALKVRLERAAAAETLSLNSYLVRALTAHLEGPTTSAPAYGSGRTSGWYL